MDEKQKLNQLKQLLSSAESSILSAKHLVEQLTGSDSAVDQSDSFVDVAKQMGSIQEDGSNRIINGIFDGQHMIGPDGKQYSVPANYASKSKLVEGDMLKLTIMNDGSFVYKQIGPVDRTRVIGQLTYDDLNEQWFVAVNGNNHKVLLASVTYFKGDVGDEVVLLIPKGKQSTWGAVENIIKKGEERPADLVEGDVEPELPQDEIKTAHAQPDAEHQEDALDEL